MARHYVSIARGTEAGQQVDYHVATSESGTDLFSFSVLDGVTPTKVEVDLAVEAIERFFQNAQQVSAAGFDVMG